MYKVTKRECPMFGIGPYLCEFICDTDSDISTLPTFSSEGTGGRTAYDNQKCASGSMAIVADNGAESKQYMLNNQDIWCPYSVAVDSSESVLEEAKAYTDSEIADLINGAPTTLDTLKEIADAMAENQTVVEALDAAIGSKADKADIPTKVSELENDSGYLTEHQDLSEYAKKTEIPTELPANGGNADTVNGHSVNADVPADAKFTDTIPVVYGDNLLINPDFKINQRGITGTFSEVGKYFVDRWKLVSGTVTINSNGSITLNGTIEQKFETPLNVGILEVIASISDGSNGIGAFTEVDGENIAGVQLHGTNRTISWVKLEYGRYDYPATPFVLPDPAVEFMKCQRYYQVVDLGQPIFAMGNTTSIIRFGVTLPTAVRTVPTVEFVPLTGDYTWSIILMKLNGNGFIKVTDAPTATEIVFRLPNYLNVKLTLNTTELAANLSYMMIGAGGFRLNLDAEIY